MSSDKINPWKYKPWWCQPWSILLTGIIVIFGSWEVTQLIWLSILVSLLILAWWSYFLLIWPKMVNEYYGSRGEKYREN
ncbi:DUF6737 family protein [Gloeocapsa sp. PCC 73106]|uniref:DUF6737 family protein n=1 Tax=Gloeocapsa sp. PCC 73106 TaxID=102232 RepID=UPI0002ACBF19|nr:DUF6737 family protein [Gloeocapsa sp. PCC 73106]ELR97473.1 hypothetical protein GLO73106DRAFT_00012830 [Gloeocapsa sp. PCC 73106]